MCWPLGYTFECLNIFDLNCFNFECLIDHIDSFVIDKKYFLMSYQVLIFTNRVCNKIWCYSYLVRYILIYILLIDRVTVRI